MRRTIHGDAKVVGACALRKRADVAPLFYGDLLEYDRFAGELQASFPQQSMQFLVLRQVLRNIDAARCDDDRFWLTPRKEDR